MANIGFISLGCAKNQVDCERMMYRVQEAGHTVKEDIVGSDVVVINTCGFIDSAKSEAIDYILQTAQLKAEGLVGKILVTGCLSQRYQGDILKELPEVDGILGTGSYTEIMPAIEALLEDYPDQLGKIQDFLRARLDADSDEKQKKRAIDALIRRGHSYGAIKKAMDALSFETEDVFED